MLTKANLIHAIQQYDDERSLLNVGFFHYFVDYATSASVTKFYYDLRSFTQNDLRQMKLTDQLNATQIERLELILNQNPASPNSTNSAICALHDAVSKLIKPENLPTNESFK